MWRGIKYFSSFGITLKGIIGAQEITTDDVITQ